MSYPSQDYMRSLPGADLQAWVDDLPVGHNARWDTLWQLFNGRVGFQKSGLIFRYALLRAGLVPGTGRDKGYYRKS